MNTLSVGPAADTAARANTPAVRSTPEKAVVEQAKVDQTTEPVDKEPVENRVVEDVKSATANRAEEDKTTDPAEDLNQRLAEFLDQNKLENSQLKIEVAPDKSSYVYKFLDPESGEVVRQFPAEEVVERLEQEAAKENAKEKGNIIDSLI